MKYTNNHEENDNDNKRKGPCIEKVDVERRH